MNEEIKEKTVILPPFKHFIMSVGEIPTSYLESMTYYEMLVWFTNYLGKTVIPAINENGKAVTELQNLFKDLQNYVNNYFDNLDVQDEINNKLDEMVEDGTLQEIIADYLNSKAVFGFNTVADMKSATNLINGSYARTLGYYDVNDGGQGTYIIIDDDTLVDDGGSVHVLNNGLRAKLIVENNTINPIMFGCKGDNSTDDSLHFYKCLKAFNNINIDLLYKEYNLPTLETFTFNKNTQIVNGIININEIIMRNKEGLLQLENVKIHAKSLTDSGNNQQFIIFGETNDTGSFILNNCEITAEEYNDINNKVCLIYLKDYSKCEINNCYFENKHLQDAIGGCLWFSNTKESDSLSIKNSTIINSSRDECLAIYHTHKINSNIIENNYFKSNFPTEYMVTFFNVSGEINKIINNTFESFTTELSIRSSGNSKVEILDNLFIHDTSLQTANSKSGIHSTNPNCIIKGNNFNFINCNSASYTIIPIYAPDCVLDSSNINFDANTNHNGVGNAQEFINCYFNNIYNIQRKLTNCYLKTPVGILSGSLIANHCVFNMTEGINGGYSTGDVIIKNCIGGIFTNNATASTLIIENSSTNYSSGSLENLTNTQTRLNYACTSGHIYFSSMDNTVVDNISKSA